MPRFTLPVMPTEKQLESTSMSEALSHVWDADEIKRFVKMGLYFPHLLTYEEEMMWNHIRVTDYYWAFYAVDKMHEKTKKHIGEMNMRIHSIEGVVWEHVQEHWPLIQSGEFQQAIDDIEAKGMLGKPGKLTTDINEYPSIVFTVTEEEQLYALSRINQHLDDLDKKE